MSFIICTVHQILLVTKSGGWNGKQRHVAHVREMRNAYRIFYFKTWKEETA